MTINEKKQLTNYIKGLVRESLGEREDMNGWYNLKNHGFRDEDEYDEFKNLSMDNDGEGSYNDDLDDKLDRMSRATEDGERPSAEDLKPSDGVSNPDLKNFDPNAHQLNDDDEIAGINELRQLAESYARESVAQILSEGKKKGSKKDKKRKNKKKKTSSRGKTILDFLKSDGVNAAAYAYELYGSKTDAEKAADRSKFYKKMNGELNDTGVPYSFNSKELAHLANRRNKKLRVK
jgi:hypothetical protein